MKKYLHALMMAQSMFCAIPCPWQVWDEEARPKMLLFLPVIGLEIGILWTLLAWISGIVHLPDMVRGLVLCAYPYIVTGFIHLDGYMDVTDAVGSWRDLERRREILKDSHVGSFAVVGCVLALLAGFALFSSADGGFSVLLFVPAVSRCCSALAVTLLKPMSTSQYSAQAINRKHGWILGVLLSAFTAAGFMICGRSGFALIGCIVGYALALRRGYKSLKGMNGDISGYALTIGELCAAAVLALV